MSDFDIIEDNDSVVKNATHLMMVVDFNIGQCINSNSSVFPCKCIVVIAYIMSM